MATIRHLNRAPIREAVVDLRVSVSDFESGQLDRFREAVTPDFPVCEKQRSYDTLIDLTQSGSTYASRDPDEGYICRSALSIDISLRRLLCRRPLRPRS